MAGIERDRLELGGGNGVESLVVVLASSGGPRQQSVGSGKEWRTRELREPCSCTAGTRLRGWSLTASCRQGTLDNLLKLSLSNVRSVGRQCSTADIVDATRDGAALAAAPGGGC